ncbi:MAG TPA: sulfatase/phosphatase domain-containing protein, partial [Pirellulales bacterium]|nr:sulfatase/phosphatase domain-containing protein [Pirellulales bacterium]
SPDLVKLMCNAAQIELPWKQHGRDIRPLLKNPETTDWKQPMMMEHMGHYFGSDTDAIPTDKRLTEEQNGPWWVLLRDGKYKYIRNLQKDETEELYDLEADPEELVNLAMKDEHRKLLKSLREKTVEELHRTEAGFADSLPRTKQMKK